MEKSKVSSHDVRAVTAENLDQARGAMENYFQFFQKSISAAPWASSDLNIKMAGYAQKNIKAAFDFAQQLSHAKDLPEVMRLQTEFFQQQLKSLTDQAKDLGETATTTATSTMKHLSKPSS